MKFSESDPLYFPVAIGVLLVGGLFVGSQFLQYDSEVNSAQAAAVVSATTSSTTSTPSGTSSVALPPPSPINVHAVASTTSILIGWSWTTPKDVGIAGYHVYRDSKLVFTTKGHGFRDHPPLVAVPYTYSVATFDVAGNVSPAVSVVASEVDLTPPSVPTALTVGAVSMNEIDLSWAASTDKAAVASYEVFRSGTLVSSSTSLAYKDLGLSPSTTYTYSVVAVDTSNNISAPAIVSTTTLPDTIPPSVSLSAPVSSTTVSGSAVTVSANASDNVGVVGVQFKLDGVNFGTEVTVSPYMFVWDTRSAANGTHTLFAVARDAAGNQATSTISVVIVDNMPPVISAVSSGSPGTTSTTILWTTDEPATSEVQYGVTSAYGSLTPFDSTLSTAHSAFLAGLTPGTIYHYQIQAADGQGNATSSIDKTFTTAPMGDTVAPTSPTNLKATVGSTTVSLGWGAATDNVKVTAYHVSRQGVMIASTTALSYKDSGLTPSTAYSYAVVALDAAGNTSVPSTASVTTLAANGVVPPAPTLSLSKSASSVVSGALVTLSWTSSNTTSCVASGDWSGNKPTASSETFPLLTTQNFTLTCSGPGGSLERSVGITAIPPSDIIATSTAVSVARFLDSLAVNTHMGYANTLYLNVNLVERSLSYLGINYVRDGVPPYSMKTPRYQGALRLAADGYKINYVMGTPDPTALSTLDVVAKAYPSSTTSVEGRNEVNCNLPLWNNGAGLPGILQGQKDLKTAIHADPYLKGVSVLNLTLCYPSAKLYSSLGNMTASADAGSAHIYAPYGLPPTSDWSGIYAMSAIPTPGLPMVVTETGYDTLTSATSSVDEAVQGKYTLDIYMDAAKSGAQRTYVYELLDLLPDLDYQHHFGLFRNDGSPKPAAFGIHNLTTILADTTPGPKAPLGTLNYSVSNLPQKGNTLLLQKSTGAYDIVVWNEPKLWDYKTKQELPAPAAQTTVNLPTTYQTVKVFDPNQGTAPVQVLSNVNQVTVVVTGSPIIIELGSTTTADVTAPSTPTNITANSATSSVMLSWSPATDNVGVVSYSIYRNSSLIATTTTPMYTDNAVVPNTMYAYSIVSFDAAGNTSSPATFSLYTPIK